MKKTHFIGIGGTGLSAIARVLLDRGQAVSGSDREWSPLLEAVQKTGARVVIGHAAENVKGASVVVRSSAIPDDNVEVQAARQAGIPVLKRSEYLADLLADNFIVAVAGSHGKTTTTAMLAWMFSALNQQPGFIVGGVVENLGVNAQAGAGRLFVIEADEYDNMFLGLSPAVAVVTNVEYDHPDFFSNPEAFTQAFQDFTARLVEDGTLVIYLDDPGAAALEPFAAGRKVITYGLHTTAEYQARGLHPIPSGGMEFTVYREDTRLVKVQLGVPGEHNAANALAAMVVADLLDLDLEDAAHAISQYRGAARRFEVLGEAAGVVVIDDYGHHPTEIKATLAAARSRYPGRRIWAVWQPHTYSRLNKFLDDFGAAFTDADEVIVTGVYAARETQPKVFSFEGIAEAMLHPSVKMIEALEDVSATLIDHIDEGDVIIVFSAGDAIQVSSQVFSSLQQKESKHA